MTTTFTVSAGIPMRRVLDVIANALDSGALRPWSTCHEAELPAGFDHHKLPWLDNPSAWDNVRKDYFAPFVEGGSLTIEVRDVDELSTHTLDLDALRRGLRLMANDYPGHFADLVAEDDDAVTASVLVQCCIFGEVMY